MNTKRIIDVPFYDAIVTILNTNSKTIEIKSQYGNILLRTPKALRGLKEKDRLRIVKLVGVNALNKVNGNIHALDSKHYTLKEWKSNGEYNSYKDKDILKEYITYEKAYTAWLQHEA